MKKLIVAVRYEDLVSGAKPNVLESILAWLELPDLAFCHTTFDAYHMDQMRERENNIHNCESLMRLT